jgi:hypothetical protein
VLPVYIHDERGRKYGVCDTLFFRRSIKNGNFKGQKQRKVECHILKTIIQGMRRRRSKGRTEQQREGTQKDQGLRWRDNTETEEQARGKVKDIV